jgi:hypothetical protein
MEPLASVLATRRQRHYPRVDELKMAEAERLTCT